MDRKYIKGSRDEVIKRFSQVHSIKMRCPIEDEGMKYLRNVMLSHLNIYSNEDGNFYDIPIFDLFNVFIYTLTYCRENEVNSKFLNVMMGCIRSLINLKYVSLEFVDDYDVSKSYDDIQKVNNTDEEKVHILNKIYDITILEFNLSNMFEQYIIDLFNKCLMLNGLMHNSYLNREFYIDFDYDGYVSFMDMFLGNNGIMFEEMDSNIMDYFRMFPVFIANQKPLIRVITNYSDI